MVNILAVLVGFIAILFLNSKEVNMGLSLLLGSIVTGLISKLSVVEIVKVISSGVSNPLSIKLIIIVTVISGLGYILKETGDLDQMIDAAVAIFRDSKLLSMLLPALIGTLSVPGGAILSAPMIEESGSKINLDSARKTAINLFFRHVFLFVYPLFGGLILMGELLEISKLDIIKYNSLIMLAGVIVAYFVLFEDRHKEVEGLDDSNNLDLQEEIINFLTGFTPVLVIIILALVVSVPFYIAVVIGALISFAKKLSTPNKIREYFIRVKKFFIEGIKYKMSILIVGVMAFKSVVEASGAVNSLASILSSISIPLSLLIVLLGLITGYLAGLTMAALGILIPIFTPLFPAGAVGPYAALLFTATFIGYLVSPIHLCLALTKEYFEVGLRPVYRLLYIPSLAMLIVALVQVFII